MAEAFDRLIDDATAFFAELRENNRKDWFDPRKDAYVARIRKPAEGMAGTFAGTLAAMTGVEMRPKVFRIYRDTRFSQDKSPYNPHLHVSWFPDEAGRPGWFFGCAPDYLLLGTGLPEMRGAVLDRYRAAVDADGDGFAGALAEAAEGSGAQLSDFGPAPLKRVPKPYSGDHPHGDLLRRKAIFCQVPLGEGWRDGGLMPALARTAEGLRPVWHWLDGALAR